MDIYFNLDGHLTLCPTTTAEDMAIMAQRIRIYHEVGIEPVSIIEGYLAKDTEEDKDKAHQLLLALAIEQELIKMEDLNKSVAIFYNPHSHDLLRYNPSQAVTVWLHHAAHDKSTNYNFPCQEFIAFVVQAINMTEHDIVPDELPDNAALFHSLGILAKQESHMFNQCISQGTLNIVLADMSPALIESNTVFIPQSKNATVH
ncbi:hypothetical protein H2O73_09315 [Vibrio sp. 404]|uniref:Uncharacterized protein n=1 Tax=Vibrio marinisediminis TaxID=2758441 RepID=A0A7W2FQV2_9VIBR|nr:hypothetical protein [Vibrio marinisediminis]MBA5762541.1 hypothetical protein [Vibrio marinisediminis]